ncbi:hypothetical protein D9619_002279 [Psilocybe cf. subviscida]|uniref:Uncharacterized protein n=1 Tax=Psilocybe cf. subviscida TaxID=2480587 RepID=A0A8H5BEF6_9AGAR|nr:hypothetical protein D9619_002279 [Psilocybe cf. subviscida]
MEQDGKLDHTTNTSTTDPSAGRIMLTLCMLSDDVSDYRHAVITVPASYEAACAESLKSFAAFIPAGTEAASL